MAIDFSQLKKGRKGNIEKLTTEINKMASGGFSADDRYWKLSVDKSGNGYAVIRFLPAPSVDGDQGVPFVRYWDHGFKGPGGYYIEKSLTTLGKDDPVSEMNSVLWNSGSESNKEIARNRKRRLHYVSNIYVVRDPANPENEGKVFLYEYGKKIFDMINDSINPPAEYEDEVPVNPFDLWEGANFKLKARQEGQFRSYDKSEFDSPSALSDDDEELKTIWLSAHSLAEEIAEDKFKSYDELKKRLEFVLKQKMEDTSTSRQENSLDDEFGEVEAPKKGRSAKSLLDDDKVDTGTKFLDDLMDDDIPF